MQKIVKSLVSLWAILLITLSLTGVASALTCDLKFENLLAEQAELTVKGEPPAACVRFVTHFIKSYISDATFSQKGGGEFLFYTGEDRADRYELKKHLTQKELFERYEMRERWLCKRLDDKSVQNAVRLKCLKCKLERAEIPPPADTSAIRPRPH